MNSRNAETQREVEISCLLASLNDFHKLVREDPREAPCVPHETHHFISQTVNGKNEYFCERCKKNLDWKIPIVTRETLNR